MKMPTTPLPSPAARRLPLSPSGFYRSQHGIALVICLAFLVLITGVVLAFFSSVVVDLNSSKSYANGANSRQLADSAVQTVMAQIREATSQGTNVAWASQPGMIRTYGTSATGTSTTIPLAKDFYKLYSSDNMVVSGTQIDSFKFADEIDNDWNAKPALYTDLNEPVISEAGIPEYPIINPLAAAKIGEDSIVEGFDYQNPSKTFTGLTRPAAPNDTNARLPMPVKWLYVLKDGTLTAADSNATSTIAKFTNVAAGKKPSKDNPIVGRMAFWTDDETCKLNLNTACGGAPWEPPMFTSGMDMHFSRFAPVTNEFTRYPGHPATTSLLPALWSYSGFTKPQTTLYPQISVTARIPGQPALDSETGQMTSSTEANNSAPTFFDNLLSLSPRNMNGGSNRATVPTIGLNVNTPPVNAQDTDRLYASAQEAIFAMASSSNARPQNTLGLKRDDLAKLQFFLTTSSKAPEVNQFNLPKMTIWPIPVDKKPAAANQFSMKSPNTETRSPIDQLMAFCSTINGTPYYFQRYDSTSATNDILLQIGGKQSNLNLYKYLNEYLKQNIPGYGGKFDQISGRSSDQILTLAFDYIRSDINLLDPSGSTSYTDSLSNRFKYAYTTPPIKAAAGGGTRSPGTGQVVPMIIGGTRGIGRFPTVASANLMFIARRANQPPVEVDQNMRPILTNNQLTINPMHPWRGKPGTPTFSSPTTVYAKSQFLTASSAGHIGMNYLSDRLVNGAFAPNLANYGGVDRTGSSPPTLDPEKNPMLKPYETQIEAIFFIDPVNVGVGQVGYSADYQIDVEGLDQLKIKDSSGQYQQLFPIGSGPITETAKLDTSTDESVYRYGGDSSYDIGKETHTIFRTSGGFSEKKLNYWSGIHKSLTVGPMSVSFPNKFGQAFEFKNTINANSLHGDREVVIRIKTATGQVVQTLKVEFPDCPTGFPTPRLTAYRPDADTSTNSSVNSGGLSVIGNMVAQVSPPNPPNPPAVPADEIGLLSFDEVPTNSRLTVNSGFANCPEYNFVLPETDPRNRESDGRYKLSVDTLRSVECNLGDTRIMAGLSTVPATFFKPHKDYMTNLGAFPDPKNPQTKRWQNSWARSAHSLRRSGEDRPGQAYNGATTGATMQPLTDFLDFGLQNAVNVPSYYGDWGFFSGSTLPVELQHVAATAISIKEDFTVNYNYQNRWFRNNWPHTTSSVDFDPNSTTSASFLLAWNAGGDFDNGPVDHGDGPYVNKPSEGTGRNTSGANSANPDFDFCSVVPTAGTFSPHRQVSSAVMFGSLPRGIIPGDPVATLNSSWQTLLFCPNPNSSSKDTVSKHAGMDQVSLGGNLPQAGKAPDFLFLDFFQMPIVQPYAISEPFSTAGKVNMNYQIAPFTYITRNTALRGVFDGTLLTAVPDKMIKLYKNKYFRAMPLTLMPANSNLGISDVTGQSSGYWTYHYPIHSEQTLQQFKNRFDHGDIFRSPSEICSLFLYPAAQPSSQSGDPTDISEALVQDSQGSTLEILKWWYDDKGKERKSLTGDNMRERPYSYIYPRLTTKSNSYTVHFRVQTLKKVPGTLANEWVEGRDQIAGEYRGSSLIERYIDAGDTTLPDFTATPVGGTAQTLDNYYKFRVVSTKRFSVE